MSKGKLLYLMRNLFYTEWHLFLYLSSIGHILVIRVRNVCFKFFEKNLEKIQQNINNFSVYFGLQILNCAHCRHELYLIGSGFINKQLILSILNHMSSFLAIRIKSTCVKFYYSVSIHPSLQLIIPSFCANIVDWNIKSKCRIF